LQYFITKTAIP